MNAAETIQAAINKLERKRDDSTPGEWWALRGGADVYAGPGLGDDVGVAFDFRLRVDAELVEMLHRTIDAQLAILRVWGAPDMPFSKPPALVLDLARAILGEVTSDAS